jgi:hemerythrin-like domain-containing protein
MDAITLLKRDHRAVEALFKKFERTGESAHKQQRKLVDEMIVELSRHAAIEEALLYPAARSALQDEDDLVLEALEEHHVVKWILRELERLDAGDERFCAKVTVLMESVRHHVREEEKELFPLLRKRMEPSLLKQLGQSLERAKALAPTRPHPRSPDEPPTNWLSTPMAAMVDRGRELAAGLVKAGAAKVRGKRGQASPLHS